MTFYELTAKDAEGKEISMKDYEGKVVLVVNTATGCGFTPQYQGLQKLYDDYKDRGLEILDFPCNQFANQAPGSDEEIHDFCQSRYGVTFKQFEKIKVNGDEASPVFKYLKGAKGGLFSSAIKWNFTKFLIDRNGNVVGRFAPIDTPAKIESEILKLL